MGAFAKSALHARRQSHTCIPKLVAQFVGGGQGLLPALLAITVKQINLSRRSKRRDMHAQQSDLVARFPVLAKQGSNLFEDFRVQLSRRRQGVSAGNSGEVLVPEFELDSSRMQPVFAEAAPDHLA